MNRTKLNLAITAGISALITGQVHASGFQLSEHSATGLGRAFAGEAAIADNAAVIASNPAAMSRFKQAAISGAVSYIDAAVEISGTSDTYSDVESDDIVPNAFVPAAYYIQPINRRWALGFGVYSNFGLSTEYDADFADGENAGSTELTTLNFNPNLSFKANEMLTLGAGVSAVYGEAKFVRNFGEKYATNLSADPTDTLKNLEGSNWGYGWNLGVLIEPSENNRFGLTYHSKIDIDFEGDYYSDVPSSLGSSYGGTDGDTVDGDLTLNLPDTFEFSGYHKLSDVVAVHYSAKWTGWSYFEEISAYVDETEVLQKDENFNDTWRYAIGSTFSPTPSLELRAGFAYEESASTTSQSISIPDSDRWIYSAGLTYHVSDAMSVDFGAMYIDGKEVNFDEGDYTYTSEGEVFITSVGVNYRF